MAESIKYAFTITLKPSMYKYTSEEQYDKTYMLTFKHLKSRCLRLTMVAEHTKAFNLHYHGIITLTVNKHQNIVKKFVDSFRNHPFIGFVNVKPMENEQGWIDYIKKDLVCTKSALGRPPLISDDFHFVLKENEMDLEGFIQLDTSDDC